MPISVEGRKHLRRFTTIKRGRESKWFFATASGSRMVYRNASRTIRMICAKVDIDAKVHPRAFRHCFAVTYIRRGGRHLPPVPHPRPHVDFHTQLYLRSMGIEHLRENHDTFSPLTAA